VRRLVAVVACAVALGACGDDGMLSGLGDRSHEYVAGSTTTTIFTPGTDDVIVATSGVVATETLSWFNEGIEGEVIGEANVVVAGVWSRGNADGRFIQASPAEIAVALPEIAFPSLVPEQSDWVTSQLVYDAASATLDVEVAAAFGLWSVEPYSDDEGRLAVLRVGLSSQSAGGGSGIVSSAVEDGLNLVWSEGPYRYELFCRSQIDEDLCWQMVESAGPLRSVSPAFSAPSEEG
jgi:hypothetical protein